MAGDPTSQFTVPSNPEAAAEVQKRVGVLLAAGQFPEAVFAGQVPGGLLTFVPGRGQKPLIPLFISGWAAMDYMRFAKVAGTVQTLNLESLPQHAQTWLSAGVEHFVLNRCPRCPTFNAFSLQALREKTEFLKVWAVVRATHMYLGGRSFLEFTRIPAVDAASARAVLETIRDHIDYGIPYLHEMIAFRAQIDQDQAALANALECLKDFGPQFENWEARWDSTKGDGSPMFKSLATAMVGLARHFGL